MFGENHNKEPKRDIFVELAKLKTEPSFLRVTTEKPRAAQSDEGTLTVDVFEDSENIIIQSTIAGVGEEDIEVNITNESVTIRGKRERKEKVEEKDYFYQELFWGEFSRSIILPQEVDPDNSAAAIKNGILTIKMPKMDKDRMKKLKVKTEG